MQDGLASLQPENEIRISPGLSQMLGVEKKKLDKRFIYW